MGSIGHISKKQVVESWGFLPNNRPVSGTWRISEYRNTRFRKIGFTLAFLDMARKNKINCQRWMYCMLRGLLWLTWLYCQGPCMFWCWHWLLLYRATFPNNSWDLETYLQIVYFRLQSGWKHDVFSLDDEITNSCAPPPPKGETSTNHSLFGVPCEFSRL